MRDYRRTLWFWAIVAIVLYLVWSCVPDVRVVQRLGNAGSPKPGGRDQ
jgi:hypothetical protein